MSVICCSTKDRVGSDAWYAKYNDKPCDCIICARWVTDHPLQRERYDYDKLNEMTLDVALLLERKHHVDGYQYNECLNVLRRGLQESLSMNGCNYCPMLGGGDWQAMRRDRGVEAEPPQPKFKMAELVCFHTYHWWCGLWMIPYSRTGRVAEIKRDHCCGWDYRVEGPQYWWQWMSEAELLVFNPR